MRALVLGGPDRIALDDVADPEAAPGEALIDVRVAGICGTDLQLAKGYMGFSGIPGHEFVGTVRSTRARADTVLAGARVAGEINIGCLDCSSCSEGLVRHCRRRRVLGLLGAPGAFAGRVTLPVSNLHAVPDTLSDEQAVFIEPVAAAFEILDQVKIGSRRRVLVLGDGRLGLVAAQVVASTGCALTVAGHHDGKLEVARSLGLTAVRSPEGLGEGGAFDVVIEATGSRGGLDQALRMVRPRGTVVLKSTCAGPTTFEASRAVIDEVTVIGSRCGRFPPAIEALASGAVKVEPLISRVFPLEKAVEAFGLAGEPGILKVLLRVG